MKPAREPASSRPKPCASLKNAPRILPVRRSLLALVARKQTVLVLAHRGLALPWLADDRAVLRPRRIWCVLTRPGFPRQCPRPHAHYLPPKGTKLELGRGAPGKHHPQPTILPPCLNRPYRLNCENSQSAASLEGEPGPAPA